MTNQFDRDMLTESEAMSDGTDDTTEGPLHDYRDGRDTIDTPDGTIHVTESLGDAELYATGLTVSQTEKVNLGNYENCEVYANLRVSINPALAMNRDTEGDVAKLLEYAHAEVENHIKERVAEAKEPDGEWE